jgi:hypothetical protein
MSGNSGVSRIAAIPAGINAQSDAAIKPFGREADQLLACGDVQFDLR